MVPKVVEEVEVEYCPSCHGLWLDQDEILQLGQASDQALKELHEVLQDVDATERHLPSALDQPCPACSAKLAVAVLGTFKIEHCTSCGGIFLDRGELDKAMYLTRSREDSVATIVALARSVVTSGTLGEE
jgi:Zn-finger nucleic acid-binding protein